MSNNRNLCQIRKVGDTDSFRRQVSHWSERSRGGNGKNCPLVLSYFRNEFSLSSYFGKKIYTYDIRFEIFKKNLGLFCVIERGKKITV